MPAGYISDDDTEYSVKVGDKFTSINEVKNLILFSMDGIGDVHLKDIANVKVSDNSSDNYTNIMEMLVLCYLSKKLVLLQLLKYVMK